MTRAQSIALWMIGALAVVAYLQSYQVAKALRDGNMRRGSLQPV